LCAFVGTTVLYESRYICRCMQLLNEYKTNPQNLNTTVLERNQETNDEKYWYKH